MKNRRLIYRVSNWIMSLAIIVILVILNMFVKDADWKIDLTKDSMYTLTQDTVDYIKTIDKETRMILLQRENTQDDYIIKIVKMYPKYNPKIKIEVLDPDKNPAALEKYLQKDNTLRYGSIVVDNGKRWEVVNRYGLVIQDSEGNVISKTERKLTSALHKVNSENISVIYMLTGHGEMNFQELPEVIDYLKDINYDVKELNLLSQQEIPEDAHCLTILGPRKDIGDQEKDIILKYLEKGGNVTMSIDVDVTNKNYNNIKAIAKEYNLSLDNNYVCEGTGHYAEQPQFILPALQKNEITENIYNNKLNIIMRGSRSISVIDEESKDVFILPLLKTSKDAWGETNYTVAPKKDKDDKEGPFNVAVAAVKRTEEEGKGSSLVIYGSSDFVYCANFPTLGNRDLFTTIIRWFDDTDNDVIEIEAKVNKVSSYTTSETNAKRLMCAAIIIPVVFAVCGVFTFIKRRD